MAAILREWWEPGRRIKPSIIFYYMNLIAFNFYIWNIIKFFCCKKKSNKLRLFINHNSATIILNILSKYKSRPNHNSNKLTITFNIQKAYNFNFDSLNFKPKSLKILF